MAIYKEVYQVSRDNGNLEIWALCDGADNIAITIQKGDQMNCFLSQLAFMLRPEELMTFDEEVQRRYECCTPKEAAGQ